MKDHFRNADSNKDRNSILLLDKCRALSKKKKNEGFRAFFKLSISLDVMSWNHLVDIGIKDV